VAARIVALHHCYVSIDEANTEGRLEMDEHNDAVKGRAMTQATGPAGVRPRWRAPQAALLAALLLLLSASVVSALMGGEGLESIENVGQRMAEVAEGLLKDLSGVQMCATM
jgi:hypothetical protein